MIENAPKGIVIPEKLPVDVGAGIEGVTCDEASGTWIDTSGVGVESTEVLSVTKSWGLISGVTVVEASGAGAVRVDGVSDAGADSGVLSTVTTIVVERLTVTVSSISLDDGSEDATEAAKAVADAADTGSLNGTVVITVVDIWRVTVLPAGMEGPAVAGTGRVVPDCSRGLVPNTGWTVVADSGAWVAGCSGESAVGVGMVAVARNGLAEEGWPKESGAGIGAIVELLAIGEFSGFVVVPVLHDDSAVAATGIGTTPVVLSVTVVEASVGNDSDVELEDAGATSWIAVCVDCAPSAVTDAEGWLKASTVGLTATEAGDWVAASMVGLAATVGEDWDAASVTQLAVIDVLFWMAASMVELVAGGAEAWVAASTVLLAMMDLDDWVDASMKELRIASSDVLPDPIPTAGTLPSCFSLVEVGAAASTCGLFGIVETMPVDEVSVDAAGAGGVVEVVEFSSSSRDVFPAPIPTAGTFPSSLPSEVGVWEAGSELVAGTPVAPVALAWSRWKEIGFDKALKRFAGVLALRTTSRFLSDGYQHDGFPAWYPKYLCIGPAHAAWIKRVHKIASKESNMFAVV
jgi:hypothetical protein